MANTGVCCASLEEPKVLMKMGLSMVLIGHVNFLIGALVHGAVLRHINFHKQAKAVEYAISNVVALTSGLVGVVVGILAIILSKNKKSKALTWSLFLVSLMAALMAAASAIGLMVSVVRAVLHGGRSLLAHCRFPDAIDYSSITNECPFDPTRIYSTTLILWVPLIVTCIIQLVFSARCFTACMSFLGLPCCPPKKRLRDHGRKINALKPVEVSAEVSTLPLYAQAPRQQRQHQHQSLPPAELNAVKPVEVSVEVSTLPLYAPAPRQQRHQSLPPSEANAVKPVEVSVEVSTLPLYAQAPRQQRHRQRQHQSLPPSERRPPLHPQRGRPDGRDGNQQWRSPEQHQLLDRGTLERSSFWI